MQRVTSNHEKQDLIDFIDNSEDHYTRLDAMNHLVKVISKDDKKDFKYLEYVMISDSNKTLRCKAFLGLVDNFKRKKLKGLFKIFTSDFSLFSYILNEIISPKTIKKLEKLDNNFFRRIFYRHGNFLGEKGFSLDSFYLQEKENQMVFHDSKSTYLLTLESYSLFRKQAYLKKSKEKQIFASDINRMILRNYIDDWNGYPIAINNSHIFIVPKSATMMQESFLQRLAIPAHHVRYFLSLPFLITELFLKKPSIVILTRLNLIDVNSASQIIGYRNLWFP